MTNTPSNLIVEIEDTVALLTINRPKALNSLNTQTLEDLSRTIGELEDNPQIHVVIITGSGDKAFVAGGDIGGMQPLDALAARKVANQAQQLFNRIEYGSKVYIAAINGYALGGGCELAMACDIRLAADSAQLGQPEINLGIIPGWGGTQRLTRLVGKGTAKLLMFTGERVTADKALAIGLVDEVVPAAELLARGKKLAQTIAAKPQIAIRLIKEAVDNGVEMDVNRGLAYEADLFGLCFSTADQKEGMQAFLEKRQAVWRHQ